MTYQVMQSRTVRGFVLGECVSALQKAIRRCDEQSAVTWAVEMDQSGFGAMLWNRLLIIASEDIGLAEPTLPANLRALYDNWKDAKARRNAHMPERLFVMHAVMLLARAKKSRYVDNAIWATYAVEQPLVAEIPEYALDGHTARGRALRRANTEAGAPDSYHLENEADVGENIYRVRKEEYRAAVGMDTSREWFKMQGNGSGRRQTAAAVREEDQEATLSLNF